MATRPDTPLRFVKFKDEIHTESKDHKKKLRIKLPNIVAFSDDFSLFVFIRSRRLAGR